MSSLVHVLVFSLTPNLKIYKYVSSCFSLLVNTKIDFESA